MEKEWSLKDKGMKGYPDGKTTGIYSQEVIDTLRRKLIEELTGYDGDVSHYLVYEDRLLATDTIKRVINKLFGVK